jgi:hypothetical protein
MKYEEEQRRGNPGRLIRLKETSLKMLPWYVAISNHSIGKIFDEPQATMKLNRGLHIHHTILKDKYDINHTWLEFSANMTVTQPRSYVSCPSHDVGWIPLVSYNSLHLLNIISRSITAHSMSCGITITQKRVGIVVLVAV